MRKRNRARSSSLFLLELIIAILFFSVASAVCVQFFVKSHTMSGQAQEMNFAANECSSVAEIVQASESEKEIVSQVRSIYPDVVVNTKGESTILNIFFDDSFNAASSSEADTAYMISADFANENGLIDCHISAEKLKTAQSSGNIYELEVKHNAQK